MICVYSPDCVDFSTNGNGVLSPLTAQVTETLNGEYELQLTHPIDAAGKWQRLVEGCILRAPVPAAMTPRVEMIAQEATEGRMIYKITTQSGNLRLRSGTGTNYKILSSYKKGAQVYVLNKTTPSWYEVTAPDGKHGYMASQYLTYVSTEPSSTPAISGGIVEAKQLRDQPFRIYRVVPELDKISVYARHVFYDLMDNMIKAYKPSSAAVGAAVVQGISSTCLSPHDFTFYSDLDATAEEAEFTNVNPVDALLGDDGFIAKYGGELTRDWFDVYLVKRVGMDTNVQIRQGKNLLGISYDVDLSDVVTRIMPTGQDKDGEVLYLPETYVDSPLIGSYTHPKWIHLEVSDAKENEGKNKQEDKKTKDQCYAEMRKAAQDQFDAGCDLPTVTLKVDFINCPDTEEYKPYGFLQNIYLGDAVRVIAPRIGVEVSMRMTQYTYDCLLKKYTSMVLGTATDTIEGNMISARQLPTGIISGSKLAINAVGPGALQSGSVGAVQIQMAAIQTAHIEDAAVTRAKIGNAAIGSAQIEDAAIVTAKIHDGAIDSAKIGEAAIDTAHIKDGAIDSAKIEEGAINTAHIGRGQIQEANIADAAITGAKITNGAIRNAHIENGAITKAKIADASIDNAKIDGAAIGTANIQNGAIVTAHILDGQVTRAKIADLAVDSAKIADLAVTTAKIAQAAITNAQIANAAVDTAQIALGAITAALIAHGAVGTAQIADASITDAKIVSLNADVITSGTLATERLIIRGDDGLIYEINAQASGLSVQELQDEKYRQQLNGTVIVARSITADQIAAATITANEILSGTITGDKIAAGTIEGSNIKAGAITTTHVSSDFGQRLDLSSNEGINQRVERIYQDMEDVIAEIEGNEVIVGTQTTSTALWTGVAHFSALNDNQQVVYWLPYPSTGSVTLNLTLSDGATTGAIPVYYSGLTRLSTQYPAGNAIRLTYKVNAPIGLYSYTGWWADANYDSGNTFDRIKLSSSMLAKSAITGGYLVVGDNGGYYNLTAGCQFSVNKPILYAGASVSAGAYSTNNYLCYPSVYLRTTLGNQTWSGTPNKTCYLVGTLSGETFTVASTDWITTEAQDDTGELVFISLGYMSTAYYLYLYPEHPMFRMVDGVLTAVSQMAYEASEAIAHLEVGGRNYLLQSDVEAESSAYLVWNYDVSTPLVAGQEYTVSMCVSPAEDVTAFGLWLSGGYAKQCQMAVTGEARQIISSTFTASYYDGRTPDDDPVNAKVSVYRLPQPSSGGETGVSKIHWVKVEKGNRATDYTVAPEDTEEALELKLAAVHAQISTEADSIRSEVQASYVLASDMSQVREQVGTLAEQTETNYTWSVTRINELQADLTAATEATEEQLNILRTYMTFGEDGLVIGKTGNPFTFRVVNDRLAFYMNNTEVAYLSNNKLYVTQAEILTKLQIGRFTFEPQSNGNLSLIYSG